MSATGVSIVVPQGTTVNDGKSLAATVHLPDEPPFTATFVDLSTRSDGAGQIRVGGRFQALAPAALRSLSRFVIRECLAAGLDLKRLFAAPKAVHTQDGPAIAKLLTARGICDATLVELWRSHTAEPLVLKLTQIPAGADGPLEAELVGAGIDQLACGETYTFVLRGGCSVMIFEALIESLAGTSVRCSFPKQLVQTGFRRSHRPRLPETSAATASFVLPWSPHRLERPIVDVSAGGLAFEIDIEEDTIFPGDRIQGMEIDLPDGTVVANAAIRAFSRGEDGGVRCGVELVSFATEDSRRRWHGFVFTQAHPRLHRSDVDLDEVWDVFGSSTYLDKWIAEGRADEIRRVFNRDWTASHKHSGELLLLKEQQQPIGTIAANQIYPRTWLMHSLAVDKRQREKTERRRFLELARELYSGMMYSLQHISGSGYFLSYFEETKNWNQRLYRDFARDYAEEGHQLYESLLVFRSSGPEAPGVVADLPRRIDVRPANKLELRFVAQTAADRLSPILVDAMALTEAGLDAATIESDFAGKGIKRRRQVLVARQGGKPVLAAICESGGEGMNIFGLMNLCWTVPLTDDPVSPAIYGPLVRAVRAHYQAHGVSDFLFLEREPSLADDLVRTGLSLVSPGIRWLARVEVLPAWLGYVENELAAIR